MSWLERPIQYNAFQCCWFRLFPLLMLSSGGQIELFLHAADHQFVLMYSRTWHTIASVFFKFLLWKTSKEEPSYQAWCVWKLGRYLFDFYVADPLIIIIIRFKDLLRAQRARGFPVSICECRNPHSASEADFMRDICTGAIYSRATCAKVPLLPVNTCDVDKF